MLVGSVIITHRDAESLCSIEARLSFQDERLSLGHGSKVNSNHMAHSIGRFGTVANKQASVVVG